MIFDVLLRKADLVEKFVAFANKPRLLQRFRERLADYKRFWQGVQVRYMEHWNVHRHVALSHAVVARGRFLGVRGGYMDIFHDDWMIV